MRETRDYTPLILATLLVLASILTAAYVYVIVRASELITRATP